MGDAAVHAVKPAARQAKPAAAPLRAHASETSATAIFAQLGNHLSSSTTTHAAPVLPVQRAALGNRHATAALNGSALRRGGAPLPRATRRFFEPRFGRDLGHVRTHAGEEAAGLARALDSRAFTHGEHVWLGAGEAAGESRLMAHELAHVVQHRGQAAADPIIARQTLPQPQPPVTRRPPEVPEDFRASLFEDLRFREYLDRILPDITRPFDLPSTSCFYELAAKVLGFVYWLDRYISAPHWQDVARAWLFEEGPNPLVVSGNSDPKNADIATNTGFRNLYGRWAAGERGALSDGSSLRDDGFRWRYELPPENSPGGRAAYNSTTHLLGTYDAFITPPMSGVPHDVVVRNKSNWESGTRLPDDVVAYLLTVAPNLAFRSVWRDHPRGQGPCRPPSLGGDLDQEYHFTVA